MPAFPFIPRIPFYRPYYSHRIYSQNNKENITSTNYDTIVSLEKQRHVPQQVSEIKQSNKHQPETREIPQDNDVLFDLFGIKLHFDDILLICLIFFLYNEGVKDELLFVSLILLLLS